MKMKKVFLVAGAVLVL
ncbi:lipoprotein, partial [Salmonella enterica]|nr:lipoprotein [Salmonella enterica]